MRYILKCGNKFVEYAGVEQLKLTTKKRNALLLTKAAAQNYVKVIVTYHTSAALLLEYDNG